MVLLVEDVIVDIYCVMKWSKFDMSWKGVLVDMLLDGVEIEVDWVIVFVDGDYMMNLGFEDVIDGCVWIVYEYDGVLLDFEYGGLVWLFVLYFYFWKSVKWVCGFVFMFEDEFGFWECYGYYNYGDLWKE